MRKADNVRWTCPECPADSPSATVRASTESALHAARSRHNSMRHHVRTGYRNADKDRTRAVCSTIAPEKLSGIRMQIGSKGKRIDSAAAAANLADLFAQRAVQRRGAAS